jgi:thioredoxin 1
MSTITLTEEDYPELIKSNSAVIIDFWADWCPPCKVFGPIFVEVSDKFPEITFAKMNVDENPNFANSHGIRSIPTLWIVKNGEVVFNQAGALDTTGFEQTIQNVLHV